MYWENSTYVQASQTESTYKDRRLTRNRSSTLVCTLIPLISQFIGKAPYKRGKRGSGKKKKEVVKVNLEVNKKKRKELFCEDLCLFVVWLCYFIMLLTFTHVLNLVEMTVFGTMQKAAAKYSLLL